jgi:hypothetical protein
MKLFNITHKGLDINSQDVYINKPLAALLDPERNKTENDFTGRLLTRAKRELTYIYLMYDWDAYTSVDRGYNEDERRETALRDSEISEDELNDPVFIAACAEYRRMQRTCYDNLLDACVESIVKLTEYLRSINYQATDNNGRFLYDVKKQLDIFKSAGAIVKELENLKKEVRNYRSTGEERIYAGADVGVFDRIEDEL